jgi:K+-sensing histidine kinase KdpD
VSKVESKPTQNERILNYIEEFGSITQLYALRDLGVMRLASRISDLRRKGYNIVSKTEAVKNRHEEICHIKRYSLGEGVNERV